MEITVYDYFVNMLGVPLAYSADLPCVDIGRPNRPIYYPIEVTFLPTYLHQDLKYLAIQLLIPKKIEMNLQLCSLVSLQRYKKALSVHQRIQMVKKTSLKADKLSQVLKDVS